MKYEKLPSKTLPSREGKNGRPLNISTAKHTLFIFLFKKCSLAED
jgi:hypothetical protein